VGVGDGPHDRQAEPVAAGTLDPLGSEPLERLEQAIDLPRGYRRAGVAHGYHRLAIAGRGR
jgi:hypothetical protein